MMPDWISELRFAADGLLPAILQDVSTREVLMMGWMNQEALLKTAETGQVWFWSRSRQELWHKGATSGHTQNVKRLSYDCDQDTLLIEVVPDGPACHTGEASCFYRTAIGESKLSETGDLQKNAIQQVPAGIGSEGSESMAVLAQLLEIVRSRYEERPEGAYTTYLFEKGTDKIVKKIGEEATEVVVAAKNRDAEELICEAGDLIYHLFVLLQNEGVPFSLVTEELLRRHGQADQRGKTK